MSKQSILITTSSFGKVDPSVLDLAKNFQIILNPYARKLSKEETKKLFDEHKPVGIIAGTETYDQEVLDHLQGLKCLSRVGVGMDSVDLSIASKNGVEVKKTGDHVSTTVSELVISFIFCLSRKVYQSCYGLKSGQWKKQMGQSVENKTLGIVGYGKIGRLLGQKMSHLGVDIIFYDPFIKDSSSIEIGRQLSFEELLKQSDIVSFNCSMSDDKPMWTLEHAKMMKPTALLINCARGGLVCEESLEVALRENIIAGAALDVFKEEPYSGSLLNLENLICTPHQGSYSRESRALMEREAMENLMESLK